MRIIEIAPLDNGAHRNQSHPGFVPDGWAIVPDDMVIPDTFPFVDIEVKDGMVVSMTVGVMPEPEEEIVIPTELEQLRADVDYIAMETGVEL
jgi:hypothetical protein